ncbi:MAG: hemolysin family protein [Armatimonadota bacterium]
MELPLAAGLGILGALLVAQGFFSASEIGYLAASKAEAANWREAGARSAGILYKLLDRPPLVISAILVGITACQYSSETLATVLADAHLPPAYAHYVAFLGVAVIWLLLAEVTPILFAIQNPRRTALLAAVPLRVLTVILWPLIMVMQGLAAAATWVLSGGKRQAPSMTEEDLKDMIELGQQQGALEEEERRMLHGVFHFADATVGQVMVPRVDMVCVESDQPLSDALALLMERRHSRLPVYEDDIDNIVGILYVKDLLPYIRRAQMDTPAKQVARPAHMVPESQEVRTLLRDLQGMQRVMAIVVDEYGGVAGLVTVEDLLEEIVGEIMDEYDVEDADVVEIGADEYLCDGAASIYELNRHLRRPIPPAEFESVSGLVYDCLGRVPREGDACKYRGLRLTVEQVDNRRVAKVRIVEVPEAGQAAQPRT